MEKSEILEYYFADYRLQNGKWNIQIIPSEKITDEKKSKRLKL